MIKVGISSCVLGQKVRFDGGHKLSRFVDRVLTPYFSFQPICPEVAINMGVPRPTVRLLFKNQANLLVDTKTHDKDFTDQMNDFSEKKINQLNEQNQICGYIVCAKSPTCGMERVKLYRENGNTIPGGTPGLFTGKLIQKMPWLPVEEDGRLCDLVLRRNFIVRVFALNDYYNNINLKSKRKDYINFHTRYKYLLLSHCQEGYKELGHLVAHICEYNNEEFYHIYRQKFMDTLRKHANRKTNTNVLMHIQGHYKQILDKNEKKELSEIILKYRNSILPIESPLTLLKHYQNKYYDKFIECQSFLSPYPEELNIRYGMQ